MPRNASTQTINDKIVDRLIELIEANQILPWQAGYLKDGLPHNYNTGKSYSGRNLLLLLCANHCRTGYMTYRQASDRGYQVRKGERGIPIVWAQNRGFVEVESEDGEQLMRWRKGGARLYYVFNEYQIDGLPEQPKRTAGDDVNIDAWISRLPVVWQRGDKPCYYPQLDAVGIPYVEDFDNSDRYYDVVFHELVHWTGAANRLNRIHNNDNLEEYSYEELVAELGAAILRGVFHIDSQALDENNAAYIQCWLNRIRGDKMMILRAATDAQRAVDYLLEVANKQPQIQAGVATV